MKEKEKKKKEEKKQEYIFYVMSGVLQGSVHGSRSVFFTGMALHSFHGLCRWPSILLYS